MLSIFDVTDSLDYLKVLMCDSLSLYVMMSL